MIYRMKRRIEFNIRPGSSLVINEEIFKYRNILSIGRISNATETQNHFTKKWGMEVNKVFDIIDTKERKLIEVKTTTNLPRI